MKKLLYAFAMMTTLFTLTSCEDERIANTLEGTWSGNMYISTRYDGRVYDATYTEVTFLKNPYAYSSGEGYWVDYYSDAPWDYVANHIEWSVDYGTMTASMVPSTTMANPLISSCIVSLVEIGAITTGGMTAGILAPAV